MKKPTESDTLRAVLQYLALRGVKAWRNNNTAVCNPRTGVYRKFGGLRGVPDILGYLPGGRFVGFEVKTPTGRVDADQAAFIAEAAAAGCLVAVVRSIDDVETLLEGLT